MFLKREFIRTCIICVIPARPLGSPGSNSVQRNASVTAEMHSPLRTVYESGAES